MLHEDENSHVQTARLHTAAMKPFFLAMTVPNPAGSGDEACSHILLAISAVRTRIVLAHSGQKANARAVVFPFQCQLIEGGSSRKGN